MSSKIISLSKESNLISQKEEKDYMKIYKSISGISENVDSGIGVHGMDLWATIDGREYFIEIKASNHQMIKESN